MLIIFKYQELFISHQRFPSLLQQWREQWNVLPFLQKRKNGTPLQERKSHGDATNWTGRKAEERLPDTKVLLRSHVERTFSLSLVGRFLLHEHSFRAWISAETEPVLESETANPKKQREASKKDVQLRGFSRATSGNAVHTQTNELEFLENRSGYINIISWRPFNLNSQSLPGLLQMVQLYIKER